MRYDMMEEAVASGRSRYERFAMFCLANTIWAAPDEDKDEDGNELLRLAMRELFMLSTILKAALPPSSVSALRHISSVRSSSRSTGEKEEDDIR